MNPTQEEISGRRERVMSRIVTGPELQAMALPPLEWIVPNVVPEGYGLLVGPPKIGKSWLTLGLALAVATGGKALGGIDVPQRPVLLLALEDGWRRLQERSLRLAGDESLPEGLNYVVDRAGVLSEIMPTWLEEHGGDSPLVILDTLGTVQVDKHPGESEYQRDYRMGQYLKGLIADYPGSCLLAVHHDRKLRGEDWMESTSGTNGVNGSADFTTLLRAERGSAEGTLSVTGRDVAAGTYGVAFDGGAWRLAGDDLTQAAEAGRALLAKAGRSDSMSAVVDALAGKEVSTPSEVAEATGMDSGTVRVYLKRLVDAGRVTKLGRGQYALSVSQNPLQEAVTSVTLSPSLSCDSDKVTDATPHISDAPSQQCPHGAPDPSLCLECQPHEGADDMGTPDMLSTLEGGEAA